MKKVLVIDDSSIQLRTLTGLMKDKYEVVTAMTGFAGIEILKKSRVDLVLLDYDMPMIDGRETMRIIKENEKTKDIPVIFLTGDNEKEDIMEVLKLHPQAYLLKPVVPERLFETIEKVIGV